jgi:hypothetical protein
MDDRLRVPLPRDAPDAVRATCGGTGAPPFPVLARVTHVFCGPVPEDVWQMVRRELAAGTVAPGDLVLLRVGRGAGEEWTELAVSG